MSNGFAPSTLALLQRHVAATRGSLAAMAARRPPDAGLFAELDSVHAGLRALPLAERVRAMSVLIWSCQLMGMSPLEVAPLLCDRLAVQPEEAFSVGLSASETAGCRALAEALVQGRPPTAPAMPGSSAELAEIGELGTRVVDVLDGVDHAARLGSRKRRELEESAAAIRAWDEARRYAAIDILAHFFEASYATNGALSLASSLLEVAAPTAGQRSPQVQHACARMVAERYPLPPLDRVAVLVRMAVALSAAERGAKGQPAAAPPLDLAGALDQVSRVERDWALVLGAAVHQQLQLKISRRVPKPPKSAQTWLPRQHPTELKQLARRLADELRAGL